MRILHLADLHLGLEAYGRPDPATGLSTRLLDFLAALDTVVDFAINTEIDLVLFCGDAYKGRYPTQTHQREFAQRIRRLLDAGISVFLLPGNHDMPGSPSRATTLDIFQTLLSRPVPVLAAQVHTATTPGSHIIHTADGPVQVVAIPWPRPVDFLQDSLNDHLTIDEVLERTVQTVTRFIQSQAQALDPSLPAILAAHLTLTHTTPSSEQAMTLGLHPLFTPADLHPDAFDYIALGHIHQHQVLDDACPIVYSGSLCPIDFGEEGETKGFYIVDIDPAQPLGLRLAAPPSFCPVESRPFVTVEVIPQAENPTAELIRAIERAEIDGAIVRLNMHLSQAQAPLLDSAAIDRALAPAHFVAYIRRHIEDERPAPRLPDTIHPESLPPLEALRLYFEQQHVASDRQDTLLTHARTLVERQA